MYFVWFIKPGFVLVKLTVGRKLVALGSVCWSTTPGKLALISVVIGPIPLLIALLGAGIAKMIGGTLDAAKVENCIVFGVDIGNVLYTMFMMHWLMIFTGGFAVLGLMASGIWALVNWVQ